MTHVEIFEDKDTFSFHAVGHAGYSTPGTDIVCSAVSMLISQLYLASQRIIGVEMLEADIEPGDAYVKIRVKIPAVGETIYRMSETGFQALADTYPAYVHVTHRGETKISN